MKYFILLSCILLHVQAAFASQFVPKNFTYLYGKTPGLDKELLELHLTLYKGYVQSTNVLNEQLLQLEAAGRLRSLEYGALKRRFGWEYNGMVLHELYFANLGASQKLSSNDPLYRQIVQDFGSFDAWLADFTATGVIRGIGWVILYREPIRGTLCNVWINEHPTNHLAGGTPLLVMDVWEHAYLTQFRLDRSAYIRAFIKNVNWDEVADRYRRSK